VPAGSSILSDEAPQPAPRATLEERAVNLNYWQRTVEGGDPSIASMASGSKRGSIVSGRSSVRSTASSKRSSVVPSERRESVQSRASTAQSERRESVQSRASTARSERRESVQSRASGSVRSGRSASGSIRSTASSKRSSVIPASERRESVQSKSSVASSKRSSVVSVVERRDSVQSKTSTLVDRRESVRSVASSAAPSGRSVASSHRPSVVQDAMADSVEQRMLAIRSMHQEESMTPEVSVAERVRAMKLQDEQWQKQVKRPSYERRTSAQEVEKEIRRASVASIHSVKKIGDDIILTMTQVEVNKDEKQMSNEEVLNKMVAEGEVEEDDMPTIQQLLQAARATRKPKTETFIIRTKQREDSIKRAVDVSAKTIVIEDSDTPTALAGGEKKTIRTAGRAFEISAASANTFSVRKESVIQPASETVVTKSWITNAIKHYEGANNVEINRMNFETRSEQSGGKYYEASISADLDDGSTKHYKWIIRPATNKAALDPSATDKDTYITSDLGIKLANFVAGKNLRKPLLLPFRPVIYADSKYAIFEDISGFKPASNAASNEGLDLEESKKVLKALARLHAASFAYFNQGDEDIKAVSETLKMIVIKNFQPSASAEDKAEAKEKLESFFEAAINVAR